ncbi:MAG: FmdB family zinc ribbon protein [Anaerolineales bacterium]
MPIYEYQCKACGQQSSLLFSTISKVEKRPRCPHCNSVRLSRLLSTPARIRVSRSASESSGNLQRVEPRKAMEHVARSYDDAGIDPGRGFEEVAQRVRAGDSPEDLRQAVAEARKKEVSPGQSAKKSKKKSSS